MIIGILLLIILPLVEHFIIVLLGFSSFAIFSLGFANSENKIEKVIILLLSLILDVTFTLTLGSYLLSFSLSYLLSNLIARLMDQSNVVYLLLNRFVFFFSFLVFRSLAFSMQNGGSLDLGSVDYLNLILPALISTALYLGVSFLQRQLRGQSGVLKLS